MSDEPLSEAELTDIEEHVECHRVAGRPDIYMEHEEMRRLLSEIRRLRLSAEDRQALEFARGCLFATEIYKAGDARQQSDRAVAVLDRLLNPVEPTGGGW